MILDLIIYLVLILQTIIIITLSVNAIFGPFLCKNIKSKKHAPRNSNPSVSILVPVRNEEKNIENCINSITSFDYPIYEIIILDDSSNDDTPNILEKAKSQFPKIKILNGKPTPEGWSGKNWACYQLAQSASGDILIFTDADNWHRSDAIKKTVDYMNHFNLDFLSAFPQQITRSFTEKIFVPVVDLIIYSFLILWTSFLTKNSAFAAANGQWISIRKKAYFDVGGHSIVKSSIVEDIHLSREFKKKGFRILTSAGTNIIFGRMYHSFSEIWKGFSKNMFFILGGNIFILLGFFALSFLTSILPFIILFFNNFFYLSIVMISLNILWRTILALRFKNNLLISIILHPLSIIFIISVAVNSFIKYKTGKIEWKGRKIKIK